MAGRCFDIAWDHETSKGRSIIRHSRGLIDGQEDIDVVWAVWLTVPSRTSEQVFIPIFWLSYLIATAISNSCT
jgi:hypothetical protein